MKLFRMGKWALGLMHQGTANIPHAKNMAFTKKNYSHMIESCHIFEWLSCMWIYRAKYMNESISKWAPIPMHQGTATSPHTRKILSLVTVTHKKMVSLVTFPRIVSHIWANQWDLMPMHQGTAIIPHSKRWCFQSLTVTGDTVSKMMSPVTITTQKK